MRRHFVPPTCFHYGMYADNNQELVASFANRSNLLKEWEKTDICAVSAYGAHGPKNAAITRIPNHALPRSPTHFSDRTALVCSGCLPPWPMREAPALRKTRNQFLGKQALFQR